MESRILNFPDAMRLADIIVPRITQSEIEEDFPDSIFQVLSTKLTPDEFMEVSVTLLDLDVPQMLELPNLKLVLMVSSACVANQLPTLCKLHREQTNVTK